MMRELAWLGQQDIVKCLMQIAVKGRHDDTL